MGWLIAAGILVLLALIPLGVSVSYRQEGFRVKISAGPVSVPVYPVRKKEKPPKEKNPEKQPDPSVNKPDHPGKKGGSWKDFLPLVRVALDLLGELRRKITVKNLTLHVVLAGDDPCDLAVLTGSMNAAVAGLLASLDRVFRIRKQDVTVCCDFLAEEILADGDLMITITLGRLVGLTVRYGWRGFKTFMDIKNQRESGAVR